MRPLLVLVLLVAVTACRFDRELPAGARVSCTVTADCPAPLLCQTGTHLCVTAERHDDVPPTLASSRLTLTPRFGTLLSQPTALGPGAELLVSLTASEPLQQAPTLEFADPAVGAVVACLGQLTSATTSEHRCAVSQSARLEVMTTVRARLTDVALNEATVDVGPLTVDLVPPLPLEEHGALVLRASPWGDERTAFKPSSLLEAQRPLDPSLALLVARRAGVTVGQAPLTGGAFSPLELTKTTTDTPVEAIVTDGAGNESPPTPVRDEVWVATFNGKRANDAFPNPHRFQVTRAFSVALDGFPVEERGERDGIAQNGSQSVTIEGAGSWLNLQVGGAPTGNGGFAAVALDPLRSRVVHFGGGRAGVPSISNDTWEWNGRDWRLRVPIDPESDGNPEGRVVGAATWDPSRRAVVVASGLGSSPLEDTWAWNGTSWKRLDSKTPARLGALLYWDDVRARLVLAGGVFADGGLTDTAFQLDERGWVPIEAQAFGPRFGAVHVTDPVSGSSAIIGGRADGVVDVWLQNPDGGWREYDCGGRPSPRLFFGATISGSGSEALLHGGRLVSDGGLSDELWLLGASCWQLVDAGAGPGARMGHSITFDPMSAATLLVGQNVVFAPTTSGPERDDTWTLSSGGWQLRSRASAPPARILSSQLLYSAADSLVYAVVTRDGVPETGALSFSGWKTVAPYTLPTDRADLLDFDGAPTLLAGSNAGFVALHGREPTLGWLAFDAGRADAGVTQVPTLAVRAAGAGPRGVELVLCCTDGGAGLMLVRTSGPALDLVSAAPLSPTAVIAAHARYGNLTAVLERADPDPLSALVLLDDTGAALGEWRMPGSQIVPALVEAPNRGSLIAPGGLTATLSQSDTWEFKLDGGWARLPLADPEGDGNPTFGLFVATGQSSTLTLAMDRLRPEQGLWALAVNDRRPAVVARFNLGELPKGARVMKATVDFVGGATASTETGDRAVLGAAAAVRGFGVWAFSSADGGAATASAEAPARSAIEVPAELIEQSRRQNREVAFAITSLGMNGTGFARLSVKNVSLTLELSRE
jgi:hypothetical protein